MELSSDFRRLNGLANWRADGDVSTLDLQGSVSDLSIETPDFAERIGKETPELAWMSSTDQYWKLLYGGESSTRLPPKEHETILESVAAQEFISTDDVFWTISQL